MTFPNYDRLRNTGRHTEVSLQDGMFEALEDQGPPLQGQIIRSQSKPRHVRDTKRPSSR